MAAAVAPAAAPLFIPVSRPPGLSFLAMLGVPKCEETSATMNVMKNGISTIRGTINVPCVRKEITASTFLGKKACSMKKNSIPNRRPYLFFLVIITPYASLKAFDILCMLTPR